MGGVWAGRGDLVRVWLASICVRWEYRCCVGELASQLAGTAKEGDLASRWEFWCVELSINSYLVLHLFSFPGFALE